MKRRSFFKVFAVAAAAAAAPSIVLADAKSTAWTTPGAVVVGGLREEVWYDIEWLGWRVAYWYDGKDGTRWVWDTRVGSDDRPDHAKLAELREMARLAIAHWRTKP